MPRKTRSDSSITLLELKNPSDFKALYPLIRQLNPEMTEAVYAARLKAMRAAGYRAVGAWDGKRLVGACGFWPGTRFWCGNFIDLDNVVVDASIRSQGLGKALVGWVEALARRDGRDIIGLDSYATASKAHRFYFREGYSILGYHFVKHLKDKS